MSLLNTQGARNGLEWAFKIDLRWHARTEDFLFICIRGKVLSKLTSPCLLIFFGMQVLSAQLK